MNLQRIATQKEKHHHLISKEGSWSVGWTVSLLGKGGKDITAIREGIRRTGEGKRRRVEAFFEDEKGVKGIVKEKDIYLHTGSHALVWVGTRDSEGEGGEGREGGRLILFSRGQRRVGEGLESHF